MRRKTPRRRYDPLSSNISCSIYLIQCLIYQEKEKPEVTPKPDEKKKMVTANRDLLMACSYFDLNHSGYFETKDLEDILFSMNLDLSRAQIKKLVNKVVSSKDQVTSRPFEPL